MLAHSQQDAETCKHETSGRLVACKHRNRSCSAPWTLEGRHLELGTARNWLGHADCTYRIDAAHHTPLHCVRDAGRDLVLAVASLVLTRFQALGLESLATNPLSKCKPRSVEALQRQLIGPLRTLERARLPAEKSTREEL